MKIEKVKSSEWEALLERCLMSLDEAAEESLRKSCDAAKRKLARLGLREPPIDKAKVKKFLLLYSKLEKRHGKCLEESGIDKTMLLTAYDLWPEAKFVRDYVRGLRHRAIEMGNEDRLADALDSLDRLNTEEDCKLNAKTVMFTLSSLDRKNYGDQKVAAQGGKAAVTYIIPNLTANLIMSPAEIAERKAGALPVSVGADEVVEAELVEAGR